VLITAPAAAPLVEAAEICADDLSIYWFAEKLLISASVPISVKMSLFLSDIIEFRFALDAPWAVCPGDTRATSRCARQHE